MHLCVDISVTSECHTPGTTRIRIFLILLIGLIVLIVACRKKLCKIYVGILHKLRKYIERTSSIRGWLIDRFRPTHILLVYCALRPINVGYMTAVVGRH